MIWIENPSQALLWGENEFEHGWLLENKNMYFTWHFLSLTAFRLLSFSRLPFPWSVCGLCVTCVFLVEYLATQTGGATVNNIFEVRFTYTKIG